MFFSECLNSVELVEEEERRELVEEEERRELVEEGERCKRVVAGGGGKA